MLEFIGVMTVLVALYRCVDLIMRRTGVMDAFEPAMPAADTPDDELARRREVRERRERLIDGGSAA